MNRITEIKKRIDGMSLAKRATFAYFIANVSVKGISVICGPIFTRIMSTEQYGIVSTFQSWQSLLVILFTLNLAQGVFNNGMLEFKEDRDVFQNSLLVTSSVSTLFFAVVYLLFRNEISSITKMGDVYFLVIFSSCFFLPAYHYWNGRQRYEFKYKLSAFLSIMSAVLSMSMGILLVRTGPKNVAATNRIIGVEAVNIAIGCVFYGYTLVKARFKMKAEYCLYALKFNIPLIPHYVSMYVLGSSDRIMISRIVNQEATAIYSVGYSIYSIIYIFWVSIESTLTPWIYQKLDNDRKDEVRKTISGLLLLYACICIVCVLFAPEIMRLLAPEQYFVGVYVIPSVAAGAFFTAVYSLYIRVEFFYKKTKFSSIATVCAAMLNILLNLVFIRMFGFVAAGYTTLICYVLLSVLHYINVRFIGHRDCFDNSKIFLISVGMIIISVGISLIYKNDYYRFALIIALAILCICRRKWIINLITKLRR